jgi:NAD(P)-dependent dehydrogenase (short-subunit alcohol dehydrogenase family)
MPKAVVVGANRGIGLEFVRQLGQRGFDVVAACRKSSPALEEIATASSRQNRAIAIEVGLDVTDGPSVQRLAQRLAGQRVDLLVHNAGVMQRHRLDETVLDSIRNHVEINTLGALRVAAALIPTFGLGSKVALVTSRMGSIGDNTSGGSYGYRISKAALNMAGVTLAHDLRSRGVSVVLLHPGYVKTDMTEGKGDVDPEQAVAGMLARIDDLTIGTTGRFVHANGTVLPW